MKGTVKFFDETKGFGFITAEDGKEIFVHQTSLEQGVTLQENDTVEFDVEEGDRGLKAVNVKLSEGGSDSSEEEAQPEEQSEEAPAEEEQSEENTEE
ncbi:MAG: hypothetical protein CMH64_01240 [Nanoarchaeota archaeon]|nr:hypothetical protein [Nanoarchaeota archaeon]|tara:strand:- start:650 stop:940 length:291 start_codon:yes stop_codon:yes gene_type:complete